MSRLVRFVHSDPDAEVLTVTNMWPEPERPVYGIFVKRQVDALRAAGVRCDVLYLRGYISPLAYAAAAVVFALGTLRWRNRYRLVHVHSGETSLAARFFVGIPIVVSYCGDDVLGDPQADGLVPLRSRVRSWVIRSVSRLFTRTITKTRQMHDRLPPATRKRNSVIPNGVDTEHFRPMGRGESRRRVGWPLDERVVLFAATKPYSPRKRLALAEAAVRDAEQRLGEPIRLHIVGSISPAEMPLLMNAADCLLMTSSVEGSPNTVKEALMCNLPVVATPAGDVESLLDGVEPSHVCPPDSSALGTAIADCLRRYVRSNGREIARPRLSAEEIAQRVISVYTSI